VSATDQPTSVFFKNRIAYLVQVVRDTLAGVLLKQRRIHLGLVEHAVVGQPIRNGQVMQGMVFLVMKISPGLVLLVPLTGIVLPSVTGLAEFPQWGFRILIARKAGSWFPLMSLGDWMESRHARIDLHPPRFDTGFHRADPLFRVLDA